MPKLITNLENTGTVSGMRRQLAEVLSRLDGDQTVKFVLKMVIENYKPRRMDGKS